MNRTKRTWILAAALMAVAALPQPSPANVQEASGISPKATSMGNAYSAVADDFSACYYNPAGLGQNDHHTFYLGYMWVKPYMKQYKYDPAEGRFTENHRGYENYRSFVFGSTVDLSHIANVRGHNLVLGVAATVGDNFKAAWRIHDWNPSVPRFIRSGDTMNRAHIFSALGLEVLTNTLYLGIGINMWQDITATVRATLDLQQNILYQEMDVDGDFEISPVFGLLLKPFKWLSLAYTFRGGWEQEIPVFFTSTLDVRLFGNPLLTLPIAAEIPLQDYFLPWNMTAGLAVRPTERLLFSVDVTHYNWSSFRLPEWRGPVKEWSNTLIPRVGAQVRVWDALVARGGYYFDPSPVPDQFDVKSNYLDTDKHVFSLGLGYAFSRLPWIGELPLYYPIEIDGYFQAQYLPKRYQLKDRSITGQDPWYIDGSAFAMGIGVSTGF